METAMRKLLTFLIALGAIVFVVVSPVSANGVLFLAGPKASASYVGPGNIQTFASWYSCAFVYNAASASTSTNMCDLVAMGTTTPVICTLRGTSSGKSDLTLCSDGVTVPAAACSGGCSVTKAYDQTGGGHPAVQTASAAAMPTLTFNALGGQPCMKFLATSSQFMASTPTNLTIPQPFTGSVVGEKTISSGAGNFIGFGSWGMTQGTANLWGLYWGTPVNISATDSVFHALNAMFNSSASSYDIDGATTSGVNVGTGSVGSGSAVLLGERAGPSFATGLECESGFAAGDQSANFAAMNSNQHSRYGF